MKRIILIISLSILSCKGESSSSQKDEIKTKINPYLTVILKAEVSEDDVFEVFFSEEIINQYHPDDKIRTNVKGSSGVQDIVFELPEKIYPMKLRIDVGSKEFETPVKLNEVILTTGANVKSFSGEELNTFFKPNKYIEIDNTLSNTYNRKLVDGVYDPFFVSINLYDLVISLFKDDYAK